jgi:tetratricopeptide (TPR) repeat protein
MENFEAALKLQPDNANLRQMVDGMKQEVDAKAAVADYAAKEAAHRANAMGITDVDQAIADYTEEVKRNPNDASAKSDLACAYYIRGLTFESKGETQRAIEDYNESIKNDPDNANTFNKRGAAYLEIGECDKSIADFEELIRIAPNHSNAISGLAQAYGERGRRHLRKNNYADAIPDFEKVLELQPDYNDYREFLDIAKAELAKVN